MCALADPTDCCECRSCAENANERYSHGTETLCRCYVIKFLGTGRYGGVDGGDSVAGSTCYRRYVRVMWKQRCGSGDENDAQEGDDPGDLLVASKWLMEKE